MRISTLWRGGMLSLLIFGFAFSVAYAQERTITGTVTSADEGPLPGVNIIIQGTEQGTVTDMEGNYSIVVPGPDAVLVFSFIGYNQEAIAVGNQSVINVDMTPDITSLKEIVVTGYASQQKKDLTGSVGVVKPKELTAMPTGNIANQLQGRTSGVTVTGDGRPGSPSKVRIRGFGSFFGNDPLYIVDGVPTQDISGLNPEDIESISVLKDAGAASIYGSRASNGVIMVTTKKGSQGATFSYNMYVGSQDPGKGPADQLLNTEEYAQLQWLVYKNDDVDTIDHPVYGRYIKGSGNEPQIPSWAGNTDWYDAITNPALIMNHDISVSGGNENAKFYGGLGYFRQDGVVLYNYQKRFSGRFNSEFKVLKDRITIGQNFTATYTQQNQVANLSEGSPFQMGVYRTQPIIPVIMHEEVVGNSMHFMPGDWGGTGIASNLGNGDNVVAMRTRDKDDWSYNLRVLGSGYLDVKILEGLNFRSTFGGTFSNGYWMDYTFASFESAEVTATNALSEGAWNSSDWVWTNTLTWDTNFGENHKLLVVGGYEAVKYDIGRNISGRRAGYYTDDIDFRTLNNGAQIVNASSNANTATSLVSIFGRADYSYKDKYMLSATVRRDGSSRFGEANRFGVFPSFSAGWRISEESFLRGSSFLSDLKIRGSWGQMGNQIPVNPKAQFYLFGGSTSTSYYDINGTGNSSVQGFRPVRIGNPDVRWETNITTNIGFDAGFFDNKLQLTFDWYQKQTEDLLYNPELPGTAGAAEPPFVNIASMTNNGIDLELIYREQWGDFGFEGQATFTTYNNEITNIAEGVEYFDWGGSRIGPFSRNMVGHPMSSFYGYKVERLFQVDDFDAGGNLNDDIPDQDGAEPGFFKFADIDGDGAITPDDRTIIGDPNPNLTYGLNLTFSWKGLDLTTFFYGSSGNDIFNWNLWWVDFWPSFQGQKSKNLLYNSWTPERPDATTPKASNKSNFSTNTQSNSYYIEDGSFFRMKNLQIGYTFPKSMIENLWLSNLRVYVQGVNLFTATKYSGMDPEISSDDDLDFGVDRGNYPFVKQYIVGLNIGF